VESREPGQPSWLTVITCRVRYCTGAFRSGQVQPQHRHVLQTDTQARSQSPLVSLWFSRTGSCTESPFLILMPCQWDRIIDIAGARPAGDGLNRPFPAATRYWRQGLAATPSRRQGEHHCALSNSMSAHYSPLDMCSASHASLC
jgi:hypothetical protein